jgi:uncharacterized membrane protein AbrB (regulator of aidB expression)
MDGKRICIWHTDSAGTGMYEIHSAVHIAQFVYGWHMGVRFAHGGVDETCSYLCHITLYFANDHVDGTVTV